MTLRRTGFAYTCVHAYERIYVYVHVYTRIRVFAQSLRAVEADVLRDMRGVIEPAHDLQDHRTHTQTDSDDYWHAFVQSPIDPNLPDYTLTHAEHSLTLTATMSSATIQGDTSTMADPATNFHLTHCPPAYVDPRTSQYGSSQAPTSWHTHPRWAPTRVYQDSLHINPGVQHEWNVNEAQHSNTHYPIQSQSQYPDPLNANNVFGAVGSWPSKSSFDTAIRIPKLTLSPPQDNITEPNPVSEILYPPSTTTTPWNDDNKNES